MMADDEQKKDETTQDEGAPAAGPVAEEDTPSSAPPAEDADEAPAEEATAPAAEEDAEEAPADAPAAAPSEEDELPWKEKRRLERSRKPSKPKPQQSPEERKAARGEARKRKAAERRKERAAARAKRDGKGTGTPPGERSAVAAKVRQGIVVSDRGQKSITVRIDIVRRHPTYEKVVRNSRTLHAHDERNEAGEGDVVRVVETRPLSKTKRWRLVEVVEKAK